MTLMAHLSVLLHAAQVMPMADEESSASTEQALGPAFADSFWVVLFLALAISLLGFDLVRRLRRAKYRAEIQEELAPELAAMREAAAAGSTTEVSDDRAIEVEADDVGEAEDRSGEADPRS